MEGTVFVVAVGGSGVAEVPFHRKGYKRLGFNHGLFKSIIQEDWDVLTIVPIACWGFSSLNSSSLISIESLKLIGL